MFCGIATTKAVWSEPLVPPVAVVTVEDMLPSVMDVLFAAQTDIDIANKFAISVSDIHSLVNNFFILLSPFSFNL